MVKIEDPRFQLASMIYNAYDERREDWRRPHLGASILGRECLREVWYAFRWYAKPDFPGRILRLFERGEREEAWLADDLRAAGMEVLEHDPDLTELDEGGNEVHKQFRFSRYGGHLGGSMDLLITGVPGGGNKEHVGECKTHNQRSFRDLEKKGVKVAKPEHYVQMQLYMLWRGTDSALYIAVNKNTDEIYIERIKLDRKVALQYEEIGRNIIFGSGKPAKVSENSAYYKCKFCTAREVCHNGAEPEKNCRTCVHSFPTEDGKWRCSASTLAWSDEHPTLSLSRQKAGCDSWEVL